MGLLARHRERREREALARERYSSFSSSPVLDRIRPRERYIFHSDYFEIDSGVGCVLTYTHNDAAIDSFPPFWGIMRIPTTAHLPHDVVTVNIEGVSRMTEQWIHDHQGKAEAVAETDVNEQARNGSMSSRGKSEGRARDVLDIGRELNQGESYLQVQARLLVKAPDLETLDVAVEKIERMYNERFGSVDVMAYAGDQRRELSGLLDFNERQRGRGMYATSSEVAGSYSLVTHGLEDYGGEYVGSMTGDVNNASVIFDVDAFRHHVVVASEGRNAKRGNAMVSDMWGSKIGQACLMNGGRVVHIILNDCDLSRLGPTFDEFTTTLDLNSGDLNMFEMFGDPRDELSIFAAQMQKLVLMAEQAYETTPEDRSIIRGTLEEIATKFYIEQRMWVPDAKGHRDRLRVVGIPHGDVPLLKTFVTYLNTEHTAMVNRSSRDEERLHALSVLRTVFANLLSNNGDLFNNPTSDRIDSVRNSRRTIYDFSTLMRRGRGIAMAQLVNVIDFAIAQCGRNDVVIFHGAQYIDSGVRDYLSAQFDKLWQRGGRVAFTYSRIEAMMRDAAFNRYDAADYTIVSNMTPNLCDEYERKLGRELPSDLKSLITDSSDGVMYIRRGYDNVVFRMDLQLNPIDPKRLGR